MTMDDWIQRLDAVLELNKKNILTHAWKISSDLAKQKSKVEYKKFKENKKVIERYESVKQLEQDLSNSRLTKESEQML
jgi:hypothetical protein